MHVVPRSPHPQAHLSHFALRDMVECGRILRDVALDAESMEQAAQSIVSFFHTYLADPETNQPNCILARLFKTHPLGDLPPDLAAVSPLEPASDPTLPSLTLLATAGDTPAWNDRHASRGHAVIPLLSADMVARAPMIAALLRQMGLDIQSTLKPDAQFILDANQRAFNVFHVEEAVGSPFIPGQQDFVLPHGVRSVLGMGGLLPSGELFTLILFSRVPIPRATAFLFRTIALGIKLALLPHTRGKIFDTSNPVPAPIRDPTHQEELQAAAATLRLLISALEDAAIDQTERLQAAYNELKAQGEERTRTEVSLRQTEKLAATGKLAASIAHEINNPLEAITNLLYLVHHDESLSPETQNYIHLAQDELQRVSEITTHMLRFHRQSTNAGVVNLIEVLESVLILFKGRLAQANIVVHRRLPQEATLTGFGGELRQIFANLVGNAIDASRLGGSLTLRVRHTLCPRGGSPGLRVTLADTGTGMTAATAARIFEPFFTTKGITGTGLGLWVTLELIQKHQGTIRVRTAAQPHLHGTVFQLFFPLCAEIVLLPTEALAA